MLEKNKALVIYGLSFLFPVLIILVNFAIAGLYPFGDLTVSVNDYYHQYYPFLVEFRYKLLEGTLNSWSWGSGMGHDYVAHYAYYLASPFNFLLVLFPLSILSEVLIAFAIIKIGLAGMFMSMFLRKTTNILSWMLPGFSLLYALCGFVQGYFANIIWLDTIMLLPLVLLGLHFLLTEGKYKLYVFMLALALWCSFYLGIFVCVAVVGVCLIYLISKKVKLSFALVVRLGICTLLAVGIASAVLIPALFAITGETSRAAVGLSWNLNTYHGFINVLGDFIAFNEATIVVGTPNIYSGLISLILLPVFLFNSKLLCRERIMYGVMLVFIIVSSNMQILDHLWNLGRTTAGFPARYTFLLSFLLCWIAYRAYLSLDELRLNQIIGMVVVFSFVICMAILAKHEATLIWKNVGVGVLYICILSTKKFWEYSRIKSLLKGVLLYVLIFEFFLSFGQMDGFISYRIFMAPEDSYVELLEERSDVTEFYRTDRSHNRSISGNLLYKLNGITSFNSTLDNSVSRFMAYVGIGSRGAEGLNFIYKDTSMFLNSILNLKYLIGVDFHIRDTQSGWNVVAERERASLMENQYYLPIGFMVNKSVLDFEYLVENSFDVQNRLFKVFTGLDDDIFMQYEVDLEIRDGWITWDHIVKSTGGIFVYVQLNGYKQLQFYTDAEELWAEFCYSITTSYVGEYETDSKIEFMVLGFFEEEKPLYSITYINEQVMIGEFNQDVFEVGYELLADEPFEVIEMTNTFVKGHVTVLEDGMLYLSIPAHRNWRAWVDGTEVEIVKLLDAFIGIPLEEGYYEIELKYSNTDFLIGILVSILSLFGLITLILWDRFKIWGKFTKGQQEALKYLVAGGIVTFVNWVAYAVFNLIGLSITVGNILAWVVSVFIAFILFKVWVFCSGSWGLQTVGRELVSFVSARIATGAFDMIAVPGLVWLGLNQALFGVEGAIAKGLVGIIVIVLNYILSKIFVFKKSVAEIEVSAVVEEIEKQADISVFEDGPVE